MGKGNNALYVLPQPDPQVFSVKNDGLPSTLTSHIA